MNKFLCLAVVAATAPIASAQAATLNLSTFQLNGSATSSGANNITLTDSNLGEAATGYSPSIISTDADFGISFDFTSEKTGASGYPISDGFSFLFQSAGINALGEGGGGLGVGGLNPSVGIAFRSYIYNVAEIFQNGDIYGSTNTQPFAFGDTNAGHVTISYVAATNLLSYDALNSTSGSHAFGSDVINLNSLLGPTSYFGFSGGTGSGTSTQSISNVATTTAVPEPATWAMMLAGFGMIGFATRRRQSVKTTVTYA